MFKLELRNANIGGNQGLIPFRSDAAPASRGLVGTKDYGFVDVGHVRHNMDRMLSFHKQLSDRVLKDGSIAAGEEFTSGVNYKALPSVKLGAEVTAKNLNDAAASLAYQESIAYEESTPHTDMSRFSTEDLPSNFLGVKIAHEFMKDKPVGYSPEVEEWGDAMDNGLMNAIETYGPLDTQEAFDTFNNNKSRVWNETKGKNMTKDPVLFTPKDEEIKQ